jgi:hypothetical protein
VPGPRNRAAALSFVAWYFIIRLAVPLKSKFLRYYIATTDFRASLKGFDVACLMEELEIGIPIELNGISVVGLDLRNRDLIRYSHSYWMTVTILGKAKTFMSAQFLDLL